VSRRIVALVASVLLAAVGGVLLLQYVASADERALAGMEATTVLVAVKPIPEGTPADKLTGLVATRSLPTMSVPDGRLTSLDQVSGRVTNTALEPGEQLLTSRFVDPSALIEGGAVPVPKGLQQISIQLDRQRVVGGNLVAGATVGVFISTETETQLVLSRVLVTDVQGGASSTSEEDSKSSAASNGQVMVTLATTQEQAQRIVYAAEHAAIWLSLQTVDSKVSGTTTTSGKNLFR